MLQRLRLLGAVAAGDVNALPVGREYERVVAVLTLASDLAEQRLLVELPVPVGVAQTVKPAGVGLLVDHDVQTAEGVEQAMRAAISAASFSTFAGSLLPRAAA